MVNAETEDKVVQVSKCSACGEAHEMKVTEVVVTAPEKGYTHMGVCPVKRKPVVVSGVEETPAASPAS